MKKKVNNIKKRRIATVWLALIAVALVATACFKLDDKNNNTNSSAGSAGSNVVQTVKDGSVGETTQTTSSQDSPQSSKIVSNGSGERVAKPPHIERPVTGGKGRIAVIIDDFGYDGTVINGFAALPAPVTFSILPYKTYSNQAVQAAANNGKQIMLHLPMQSQAGNDQESTTINDNMSDEAIRQSVIKALQAVPNASGVNNHQGSAATTNPRLMKDVMSVLRDRGLYFVDSRTASDSIAYDEAKVYGLAAGENILFIDNSSDYSYIVGKLRRAAELAKQNGTIIIIGHARTNTLKALRDTIPELQSEGVTFIAAGQAVQ